MSAMHFPSGVTGDLRKEIPPKLTQLIQERWGLKPTSRDVYPRPSTVGGKSILIRGLSLNENYLRKMIALEQRSGCAPYPPAPPEQVPPWNFLEEMRELHLKLFQARGQVRGRNREIRNMLRLLSQAALANLMQATAQYPSYAYFEVGNLIFTDRELYYGLDSRLRRTLKNQLMIVLEDLDRSYLGMEGEMKGYTLATIMALSVANLSGKCVIDAGSNDGILALVAAKLGAAKIVLIDIDSRALETASRNLKINGIGKSRWLIIEGDLRCPDRVAKEIPATRNDCVIVSNLGDWVEYKGANNQSALRMALDLEKQGTCRITDIILGGYRRTSDGDGFDRNHHPDADIAFLTSNRFRAREGPVAVNIADLAGAFTLHGGFAHRAWHLQNL